MGVGVWVIIEVGVGVDVEAGVGVAAGVGVGVRVAVGVGVGVAVGAGVKEGSEAGICVGDAVGEVVVTEVGGSVGLGVGVGGKPLAGGTDGAGASNVALNSTGVDVAAEGVPSNDMLTAPPAAARSGGWEVGISTAVAAGLLRSPSSSTATLANRPSASVVTGTLSQGRSTTAWVSSQDPDE